MVVRVRWARVPGYASVDWITGATWARRVAAYGSLDIDKPDDTEDPITRTLWGERADNSRGIAWIGALNDTCPAEGCGALSRDGELLAVAGGWSQSDQAVRVFTLNTDGPIERGIAPLEYYDPAIALAFSSEGRWLAIGTLNGTVRVWDVVQNRERVCIGPSQNPNRSHIKRVLAIAYNPAGGAVLSGSRDHTASLWDDGDGSEIARFRHSGRVTAVGFANGGRTVLTGAWVKDPTIGIWEAATGRRVNLLNVGAGVTALAVSPDDRWLISGDRNGSVVVWDLERGHELQRLAPNHEIKSGRDVCDIAFLNPSHFAAVLTCGKVMLGYIRAG